MLVIGMLLLMPTVTLTHQGTLTESLHGPARVALAPD